MVEPQEFSVTFLDVGQGDSAVICRATPGIIHVCAGSIEMRIADGEDEPQISPTLSSHLSRMHGLAPACQDWLPQNIPHKVG
jgi:beta-lactamase superfamily II metal-dependent hydrolase